MPDDTTATIPLTKEIPLTQGKVAIVDAEDYAALSQSKWSAVKTPTGIWYAITRRAPRLMHRRVVQAPDDLHVDHKDGNGLNNTKRNLRFATDQQNHRNRQSKRRFKGTWLGKRSPKYGARITVDGKPMWLGYYASEELAAKAYDQKAKELFGDFARLNFPEGGQNTHESV